MATEELNEEAEAWVSDPMTQGLVKRLNDTLERSAKSLMSIALVSEDPQVRGAAQAHQSVGQVRDMILRGGR